MTNWGDVLHTLNAGLPRLHDDAFSPIKPAGRAAGFEANTFTEPFLTGLHDRHVAHPGLRHGSRPVPPVPSGNREARQVWDKVVGLLAPDAGRGACRMSPGQVMSQVRRQAWSPQVPGGVATATRLVSPWATTRLGGRQCIHRGEGRCQGSPVVAKGLCRACYDRYRRGKMHGRR